MDDIIWYTDEKTTLTTLLFAQSLGMQTIGVLFPNVNKQDKERFLALQSQVQATLKKGVCVEHQKDVQKARGAYEFIVGLATRELVEFPGVQYLLGAETLEEKDKTHRRGSGMNQVIGKLLAEKRKTYIFDLSLLHDDAGTLLGRMQQNKRILSKYDVPMICLSMAREPLDVRLAKERQHFLTLL